MLKRLLDVSVSLFGLAITFPVLAAFAVAVWLQDYHSPIYAAGRVGRNGREFKMIKLRSMVVDADRSGVTSTSADDRRITAVGRLIRACKLDEITQLWNVLKGDMSLVGPRPNVMRWGVELYTDEEMRLLSVRPGITDFSSIVFSDEGSILATADDPDLAYNRLIRPWKSRLSLFYLDNRSAWLDVKLILYTAVAIFSRRRALGFVIRELRRRAAPTRLIEVARRNTALEPFPPPGSQQIVVSREQALSG